MCGKSLADFGADVILIEPPEGHPSRFHGPYPGGREHPEKSFQFLYLNANKRSLVLDLARKQDSGQLRNLISESDIFATKAANSSYFEKKFSRLYIPSVAESFWNSPSMASDMRFKI